jgi:hypothetical protein
MESWEPGLVKKGVEGGGVAVVSVDVAIVLGDGVVKIGS